MLINIHQQNPSPRKIQKIVNCLKNNGVIIYPTDTVYAFGCDIYNKKAMERLCQIKGVDIKKHNLSFICYDLSHISNFTKQLENNTYKLMKKTLPGPYTFILNANSSIPKLFKNKKKCSANTRPKLVSSPLEGNVPSTFSRTTPKSSK